MVHDPIPALIAAGRTLAARGWVPATSGSLSARAPDGFWVTVSGLDKGALGPEDFVRVDAEGRVHGPGRPSAEAALHAQIYGDVEVGAVLHVHSLNATVLSRVVTGGVLLLEGYELLKAFAGVRTHETTARVFVAENSQDMAAITRQVAPVLDRPDIAPGYLVRGHGLYAWGATVADALRHVEALDFLFGCQLEHRRIRS